MEITSVNNEKVKNWARLKEKKYRDLTGLFLIEGSHLVKEAIEKNLVKEIIALDEKDYKVDTYKVNKIIMKKLSSQVSGTNIIAVCDKFKERNINGNILIIDNIQDPGNMGTIIRSAVAFGIDSIVISNDTVDIYNDKVIRSSEGMIFNINIIRCDIKKFLSELNHKYLKVSTNVQSGSDIKTLKYEYIALVIGSEGTGVSEEINLLCDNFVNIKMNKECESLNAGVSASILMYEVYNG